MVRDVIGGEGKCLYENVGSCDIIEKTLSLIVLFGTFLSCMKLTLEFKGVVKNVEIDGGAMKKRSDCNLYAGSDGISYECM